MRARTPTPKLTTYASIGQRPKSLGYTLQPHYHAAPTAYGSVPTHQICLEDILSLPWALRVPSPGGPSSGGDLFGAAPFIPKAWLWGPHRHTGSQMSVPLGLDWRLAAAWPSGCPRHRCTAWGPRNVASFPPSHDHGPPSPHYSSPQPLSASFVWLLLSQALPAPYATPVHGPSRPPSHRVR